MAATTQIRQEVLLGPVRSVVLDVDETGSRAVRRIYSLNVLDGWVQEGDVADESGLRWENLPYVQHRVGEVLDAAPGCANFIAESHLLWIEALRRADQARQAGAQRRALEDALRRHGLALVPDLVIVPGRTSEMADPPAAALPDAVPSWPPTCPDDDRELQRVLYKQVRHFRCPACRMVYYSVSDRVGDARGRLSMRYLKLLDGERGTPLSQR